MEIGNRLRQRRQAMGLTLEELASRSELTKGFLSQVERDLTSPSISTLEDILEALGTSLPEFFSRQQEQTQIVFTAPDWFTDEQEGYTIDWVIPNAQKNDMEPIRLTLKPGGMYEMAAHEGQEFGYVLPGCARLDLDDSQLELTRGSAFYLDGAARHALTNPGGSKAVILWVTTPPAF